MNLPLFPFLLAIASPAPAAPTPCRVGVAQVGVEKTVIALVVGVSNYQEGTESGRDSAGNPGIQHLRFADDDARAFSSFLATPMGGELPALTWRVEGKRIFATPPPHGGGQILLVDEQATTDNLLAALTWALENRGPNTVLRIFFAGHATIQNDKAYLLPYDAPAFAPLAFRAISLDYLKSALADSTVGYVELYMDACYSGAARTLQESKKFQDEVRNLTEGNDRLYVLASSLGNQVSHERTEYAESTPPVSGGFTIEGAGHGAYTRALLEAFRGQADLGGDGCVDLGEVSAFVPAAVSSLTHQSQLPHYSPTFQTTQVVSVRGPGWVDPAGLARRREVVRDWETLQEPLRRLDASSRTPLEAFVTRWDHEPQARDEVRRVREAIAHLPPPAPPEPPPLLSLDASLTRLRIEADRLEDKTRKARYAGQTARADCLEDLHAKLTTAATEGENLRRAIRTETPTDQQMAPIQDTLVWAFLVLAQGAPTCDQAAGRCTGAVERLTTSERKAFSDLVQTEVEAAILETSGAITAARRGGESKQIVCESERLARLEATAGKVRKLHQEAQSAGWGESANCSLVGLAESHLWLEDFRGKSDACVEKKSRSGSTSILSIDTGLTPDLDTVFRSFGHDW